LNFKKNFPRGLVCEIKNTAIKFIRVGGISLNAKCGHGGWKPIYLSKKTCPWAALFMDVMELHLHAHLFSMAANLGLFFSGILEAIPTFWLYHQRFNLLAKHLHGPTSNPGSQQLSLKF